MNVLACMSGKPGRGCIGDKTGPGGRADPGTKRWARVCNYKGCALRAAHLSLMQRGFIEYNQRLILSTANVMPENQAINTVF